MEEDGDLVLKLYGAKAERLPGNVLEVTIHTSGGEIQGILHPAEGKTEAVVWLGGASGDMNGPGGGLFADLSHELVGYGLSSFRLRYRKPGDFQDCVLDALAGISFLRGHGVTRVAVVGHSFGGAVAISTGALSEVVTTVIALSSQSAGTHFVTGLAPRPLLLVHGLDDFVIPNTCAEDIYGRAREPKKLVLYPGTGHSLSESRSDLEDLIRDWLAEKMDVLCPEVAAEETSTGTVVYPLLVERPEGLVLNEVALFHGDIADVEADGVVCPTNDQLWLGEGVARTILEKGGEEILFEAQHRAPGAVGSATAIGAGHLKAKYVIIAVTGATMWSYRMPDEESVRESTRSCLRKAEELQLKSIAFPALGTGQGGFAFEKAAHIMVQEVLEHFKTSVSLRKVIFALLNKGTFRAFEAELKQDG